MPRNDRVSREKLLRAQMEKKLLERLGERRRALSAFRAQAARSQSLAIKIADKLTSGIGSIPFLVFHICLFTGWIAFNLKILSSTTPFDPFPFGLLTLIMTLEQSLLTIFIIMSQNRASETADLRNEMDLQINILAEEEITKVIQMLRLIGEKLEIDEIIHDQEARIMETPINHVELEKQTQQEIDATQTPAQEANFASNVPGAVVTNVPASG